MRVGALASLLAIAPLLPGCIALPFVSLGGRGRVAVAGTVGDVETPRGRADVAVQAHIGTAILSVTDPGPRDLDVEVGYALDAFPGHMELDRHGGYAGLHGFVWNDEGARVSVGGDVDMLWGFDQRLALGATLSAGIEAYAGCTGAMGAGDVAYAGLVGFGRGEWGFGVQAQLAYRFIDGESQLMIGASLSLRFPAGVGVGYLTALGAAEIATSGSPTSAPGSTFGPEPEPAVAARRSRRHEPVAPFGFCERPIEYVSPDAPPRPPEPDRWRCVATSVDALREEGFVRAASHDEAESVCVRDFDVTQHDGARCECSRAP